MTDYTTLSNTAVGVGGLPSGATVTALRDNPLAIAEGTSGAPKVQGLALDNFFIGIANGSGSTAANIILGTASAKLLRVEISGTSVSGADLQIALSSDGGATFGAWQDFFRTTSSTDFNYIGSTVFNLITAASNGVWMTSASSASFTSTITPLANTNALSFRMSASGIDNVYRASVFIIGGVA